MKNLIVIIVVILFGCSVFADVPPTEEELQEATRWYVEERMGRVFYYTHGAAVWGHEFGFYKNINDYENDILWLTYSSIDEKVKELQGSEVIVQLDIDGTKVKVNLDYISAGTIGFTHIMHLTNWVVGDDLIKLLSNGKELTVHIIEPKELKELIDINGDIFSLEGFAESRKKAEEMCKNSFSEAKRIG